jgi:uncharacterized protein YigE (DUF2233 family)
MTESIGRRAFLKTLIGSVGLALTQGCLRLPKYGLFTETAVSEECRHIFITKAEHKKYRAKIVTAFDTVGKPFATTTEILDATGGDVCLNGGFFENDGSPSGLLITNGQIKRPFIPGKGDGVLHIDRGGQIHINAMTLGLLKRYISHRGDFVYALQLNLLSRCGDILYRWWKKAKIVPRNFIGISYLGIVDVIFKDTTLARGDEYMRLIHNCHTVGALDGGGSASAVDRSGGLSYRPDLGDSREVKIPNFVVLFKR